MARIKFNKMGNDLPLPAEEGATQHMRFGMVKVNKAEAKDEDSGPSPWTWTILYSRTLPMKDGDKNWNLLTTNKREKYYCCRPTISREKRVSDGLLGFFEYMLTHVDKLLTLRIHLEEGDQQHPHEQRRGNHIDQFFFFALREKTTSKKWLKTKKLRSI